MRHYAAAAPFSLSIGLGGDGRVTPISFIAGLTAGRMLFYHDQAGDIARLLRVATRWWAHFDAMASRPDVTPQPYRHRRRCRRRRVSPTGHLQASARTAARS